MAGLVNQIRDVDDGDGPVIPEPEIILGKAQDAWRLWMGEQLRASETLSAWIATSLFAMNGGGMYSFITLSDKVQTSAYPGAAFGLGIGAALVAGYFYRVRGIKCVLHIIDALCSGAQIDAAAIQRCERRWRWAAEAVAWLSGAAFAFGAIWMGMEAQSEANIKATYCSSIENVMSKGQSLTTQQSDLYKALTCIPKTRFGEKQ